MRNEILGEIPMSNGQAKKHMHVDEWWTEPIATTLPRVQEWLDQ